MNKGVTNFENKTFISEGVDLNDFCKETMIKRFENVRVTGDNVLVLIFKNRPKRKTIGGIILPDTAVREDMEYHSMVGMVLQIGPDAYKDETQFPSGPYVKVGDWVVFPRGASLQGKYEDEPIILVGDYLLKLVVDDPSKISR